MIHHVSTLLHLLNANQKKADGWTIVPDSSTRHMTMKALQPFKVGQVIKNAIGYLEEGERDLFLQTKNRNMLSGPALYVDHDDQPNAVFVKQTRTKVGIQVIQAIAPGEKITITYGVDDRGETRQRKECLEEPQEHGIPSNQRKSARLQGPSLEA